MQKLCDELGGYELGEVEEEVAAIEETDAAGITEALDTMRAEPPEILRSEAAPSAKAAVVLVDVGDMQRDSVGSDQSQDLPTESDEDADETGHTQEALPALAVMRAPLMYTVTEGEHPGIWEGLQALAGLDERRMPISQEAQHLILVRADVAMWYMSMVSEVGALPRDKIAEMVKETVKDGLTARQMISGAVDP